jgi:hypothetical protein
MFPRVTDEEPGGLMSTRTPWGPAQDRKSYGRGIVFYSTAGHGGFHVCPTLDASMPPHLRRDDGWYEEDCDWCLVVVAFPDRFDAEMREQADRTVCNWHPEAWETHHHKQLEPGQSFVRDERCFREAHRQDYVVTSAVGDWHEDVPAGFVGVSARRASDNAEIRALVPADEYAAPRRFGFVVDPGRHARWTAAA